MIALRLTVLDQAGRSKASSVSRRTVLGTQPTHGRLLTAAGDGRTEATAEVVVSRHAWTTRFGRDPDVLGRSVRLGPQAFTVVGIAANPLPGPTHRPDFWVLLPAIRQLLPDSADFLVAPRGALAVHGRAPAGVDVASRRGGAGGVGSGPAAG